MVARGDLGRRAAAGAGAAGPEARGRAGPRARQAGHRRHPDARVDDRCVPADPRRGLRRRQRRARRRRRADAVRRDVGGALPDRDGARRWPGSSRPSRRARWTTCRRCAAADDARPGAICESAVARRRDRRREVPRRVHRDRRLGAPAGAAPLADPVAGVHARTRRCAASWRCRWGVETFLVPVGPAHRRDGPAGRRGAARHRPLRGRRRRSSSSPARRPGSPARRTRCACTAWATPSAAPPPPTSSDADLSRHDRASAAPADRRTSSSIDAGSAGCDRAGGQSSGRARRASGLRTPQAMNCSTSTLG